MGIGSVAKRIVHWLVHPEAVGCSGSAEAVEAATDRLTDQAKALKKVVKANGRQRKDMLGLALDDLRGRKLAKAVALPTEIPPPPKITPAAVNGIGGRKVTTKKRRG